MFHQEKEEREYAEKLARMKAEDEERTAKNRSKRRRKNKDNGKPEKKVKTGPETQKVVKSNAVNQEDEREQKAAETTISQEVDSQ